LMATKRDDVIRSLQKFALHFEREGWTPKNWKLRLKSWFLDDAPKWGRKSA
jgi:hypothetical protein